jgi:hypothetical protein
MPNPLSQFAARLFFAIFASLRENLKISQRRKDRKEPLAKTTRSQFQSHWGSASLCRFCGFLQKQRILLGSSGFTVLLS